MYQQRSKVKDDNCFVWRKIIRSLRCSESISIRTYMKKNLWFAHTQFLDIVHSKIYEPFNSIDFVSQFYHRSSLFFSDFLGRSTPFTSRAQCSTERHKVTHLNPSYCWTKINRLVQCRVRVFDDREWTTVYHNLRLSWRVDCNRWMRRMQSRRFIRNKEKSTTANLCLKSNESQSTHR